MKLYNQTFYFSNVISSSFHLSFSVFMQTGCSGGLVFTDQDLRLGDPSDTIRRASMMPGQLQDSLVSHRQSLMSGQMGAAAGTRSHRLSLMPGQLPSKNVSCAQMKSPKNSKQSSSSLSAHLTSPEVGLDLETFSFLLNKPSLKILLCFGFSFTWTCREKAEPAAFLDLLLLRTRTSSEDLPVRFFNLLSVL